MTPFSVRAVYLVAQGSNTLVTELTLTCLRSTKETLQKGALEEGAKYVQR